MSASRKPKADQKSPIKILLLGDAGVGKSTLALRAISDSFSDYYYPTIGASFSTKIVEVNETCEKLQVWDLSGQERFRSMSPMYTRGTNAMVLVFDLTNYESFLNLQKWLAIVKESSAAYPNVILVGNKRDEVTKRVITQAEIDEFKNAHKNEIFSYIEVSAKTAENLNQVFEETVRCVRSEAVAVKQQMIARNKSYKRNELINELATYIARIEENKKNGVINFKQGFWHHKDSRAYNRQANFLLAKELYSKLKNSDESIESVFANHTKSRSDLITFNNLNTDGWPLRKIHSSELNKIISHAAKVSKAEKLEANKPSTGMRKSG